MLKVQTLLLATTVLIAGSIGCSAEVTESPVILASPSPTTAETVPTFNEIEATIIPRVEKIVAIEPTSVPLISPTPSFTPTPESISKTILGITSVPLISPTPSFTPTPESVSKTILGMRIEETASYDNKLEVVTTGAKYVLDFDGTVHFYQRIPEQREVGRLILPKESIPFTIENVDDFTTILSGSAIRATFHGDSLLILNIAKDTSIRFTGLFTPSYHYERDGKYIFIDEQGGFGVYPVGKKETVHPNLESDKWDVTYNFENGDEVWVCTFPPREYNWDRASRPLAHSADLDEFPARYPDKEFIRSASEYVNVLTVHSFIWGVTGPPWLIPDFVPRDMDEFVRIRDEVQKRGMNFVVYFSPVYSRAPDFFAQAERALDQYKVDGLYFDGTVRNDFSAAYNIVRQGRELLGDDRILYIHSGTSPFGTQRMFMPCMDTYADYTLRGEAGRAGLPLDDFLRYIVSGYKISNSVGYWAYFGSAPQKTPGEPYWIAPNSEDIDAAIKNNVQFWWWFREEENPGEFNEEYYRKLRESLREHNNSK